MSYTVIVCDLFHAHQPDHETVIEGFPSPELAVEYARRRLRASLEDLRQPGLSAEELRGRWRAFGEDCRAVGPAGVFYVASSELEHFLSHPATPEERDWLGLYRALQQPR